MQPRREIKDGGDRQSRFASCVASASDSDKNGYHMVSGGGEQRVESECRNKKERCILMGEGD